MQVERHLLTDGKVLAGAQGRDQAR